MAPLFLGMAPVLGKYALMGGTDPFTVAALRTGLVVLILWAIYAIFSPRYIYIYPAGLLACTVIGFTNGIGSLFYYSGLQRLDASVAQLLNATYVIFVVLLTRISGARISSYTIIRVSVALLGVLLVTGGLVGQTSWLGIGLMLGNSILFAGTMVMSQRILYEMPAQTVTLYVMTAMAVLVVVARIFYDPDAITLSLNSTIAIVALAVTTTVSRLTLFMGVKGVGSLKTALLAIGESGIAMSLAFVFLDEYLTPIQWVGVIALFISIFMPTDRIMVEGEKRYDVTLPNVAGLRFRRMSMSEDKLATREMRGLVTMLVGSTEKLTTQQMEELRRIIGEEGLQKLKELEATHSKSEP